MERRVREEEEGKRCRGVNEKGWRLRGERVRGNCVLGEGEEGWNVNS